MVRSERPPKPETPGPGAGRVRSARAGAVSCVVRTVGRGTRNVRARDLLDDRPAAEEFLAGARAHEYGGLALESHWEHVRAHLGYGAARVQTGGESGPDRANRVRGVAGAVIRDGAVGFGTHQPGVSAPGEHLAHAVVLQLAARSVRTAWLATPDGARKRGFLP